MGRLSEYDEWDNNPLSESLVTDLVVGSRPREIRWDDLSEADKRFYVDMYFFLCALLENSEHEQAQT